MKGGALGGNSGTTGFKGNQLKQSPILYISYDGMLEPLGQSQVLAYLERLTNGRRIHLISFEKAQDWANVAERERTAREVADAGIVWHPLRYHKRPSAIATAWDITCGIAVGLWLVARHRLRIVHARSYVASVIALVLKRITGVKYLFDMRGFWADEKVDNGHWFRGGLMYRITKGFERRFLLAADRVVSLTHAAVAEMQRFDYLQGRMPVFEVIPTCTNLELFRPKQKVQSGRMGTITLGYVGSATFSYLFDEALVCYKILLEIEPGIRLVILNREEHEYIRERLLSHGIDCGNVDLRAVPFSDMPSELAGIDAAIFFIRQAYSKIASAPTKLGEVLGCGVPCLGNTGVGDMASILEGEGVGVLLGEFSKNSMREAGYRFLSLVRDPDISNRCRRVAEQYFSLTSGVRAYDRIYRELATPR